MSDEKLTQEQALRMAYEAGRQSAAQEQGPERFEFSNGRLGSPRGGAYETELSALVAEIRTKEGNISGRRLENHPDVVELKARHGHGR